MNSGSGAATGSAYSYSAEKAVHPKLSEDQLWKWCQEITAIGPRVSGTPGAEKCRAYLQKELKALGWETKRREFTDRTPRGPIAFANIHARFPAAGTDTWSRPTPVLVCSHYDTKWYQDITFVGANDGGSGNAACLEMARLAAMNPMLAQRLEIVFFDGEEAFINFTALNADPYDGLFGSRHLQKDIRTRPPAQRPKTGLLFDMIADKDLNIGIPPNSSPRLARLAAECAAELGLGKYLGVYQSEILDDHVPLMFAGVEMTNFIDLDYRPWHTKGDTLDAISKESLAISTKIGVLLVEKYLAAE